MVLTNHIILTIKPSQLQDSDTFIVLSRFGSAVWTYDDGFGPLWVYCESLGIVGVCRAQKWHEAYEIAQDEWMHDADPQDPYNYRDEVLPTEDNEDWEYAEGIGVRSSGEPSNPYRHSYLYQEDLNGSALDQLTDELAEHLELTIIVCRELSDDWDTLCGDCYRTGIEGYRHYSVPRSLVCLDAKGICPRCGTFQFTEQEVTENE